MTSAVIEDGLKGEVGFFIFLVTLLLLLLLLLSCVLGVVTAAHPLSLNETLIT